MTAEQVFRAAVIKQMEGYSYRILAFHLADSRVYSWFCRIGFGKRFKMSTLQRCIKAISDEILEQINRILLVYAGKQGIEKGRKARVDCTVVESNIHTPYDSELLFDATRVVAKILAQVKTELPELISSSCPPASLPNQAASICRRIGTGPEKKIVSIFEPHTDIIRKDRRDTYYGHKICLTGGASNLILDCVVLEGNPLWWFCLKGQSGTGQRERRVKGYLFLQTTRPCRRRYVLQPLGI